MYDRYYVKYNDVDFLRYRSKDESIKLVSKIEFYREAPESISRPVSTYICFSVIQLYEIKAY